MDKNNSFGLAYQQIGFTCKNTWEPLRRVNTMDGVRLVGEDFSQPSQQYKSA